MEALTKKDLSGENLLRAVRLGQVVNDSLVENVKNCSRSRELDQYELAELAQLLSTSIEGVSVAQELLAQQEQWHGKDPVRSAYALTSIALGEFDTAIRVLIELPESGFKFGVSDHFNLAMAKWGLDSAISRENFSRVVDLANTSSASNINFKQCLAIACWAVGDTEQALDYIDSAIEMYSAGAPGVSFSCWSYLYLSGRTLEAELKLTREFVCSGEHPDKMPEFLSQGV